jgi:hypothetical protein
MSQLTIRFPEARVTQIRTAAREKGFVSPTALMRHAIERELAGDENEAEKRITAVLHQIGCDLDQLGEVQQTLFAFVDTLAKTVLTAMPEQPSPSVARGKNRYERFLQNAAATLVDGMPALLRKGVES